EMFERDVQPVLDDYLEDRIDEDTFVRKARAWGNYATAYRPLVEAAKAAKIPVVAANFPGSLRRTFANGAGKEALDKLPPEQRALVPDEIFPASAKYWERVDRAVRGHMGSGGGGTPEERLYDTQNLWDNAMGDNIARARKRWPDRQVVHVVGGFHVAWRDGTAAQFARRSPDSSFAVVSIAATSELHSVRPDRDRAAADFVVYARTLSREENDGTWAVEVPAELRYQIDVPEPGTDLPLLVWLPDRSSRPDDALALWRARLGSAAAIAVVHAPFPELQDDLALGGRYAYGDGFRADYSRVAHGLARIVEYATRKFPIDGKRVVVAGAGDGGAAVLWTALYGEWLAVDFVASEPNDLTRLGMEALPDQKPVARSLHVLARDPAQKPIAKLVADYASVGTPTSAADLAAGDDVAAAVRQRLGLPAPAAATTPLPRLAIDTPRAREWRDLLAARGNALPATASRLEVGGDGAFPVATFANGTGLPLAGGPFGGTTIVVLPKGTSDADRTAWLAHESNRVLKKRSMFANIAIASQDGEPSLAQVLTSLKQKGRARFLVVPALFCADAATMQALRASAGVAADGCDIAWLPGLGAALAER
ncbi:MAG: ChaN family lipoprotein, partial [Planctomycetes bacterium]|nr:ChaN family lipoprotein [Planctomycetota bacterium]